MTVEIDWNKIGDLALISRELDLFEESRLYPREIPYQFSSSGHELSQLLLAEALAHPHDAVGTYYRGRPLLLGLGLSLEEALLAGLAKAASYSAGRDIGVVSNLRRSAAAQVLPTAGDVGSQYTPSCGWAEAISYRERELNEAAYRGAIAVAHGGEGSVASNGFWAALNLACTRSLPLLFFIEDNGFAISVTADKQTPGGNIAANLRSYQNLRVLDASGIDPEECAQAVSDAVTHVRSQRAPALLRLRVVRLSGHSGQDSQTYKTQERKAQERKADPLRALQRYLGISDAQWNERSHAAREKVRAAYERARDAEPPAVAELQDHVFAVADAEVTTPPPKRSGSRINMVDAIRETLTAEMLREPRILVLGEDIGAKGGVHTATQGLLERFGARRVVDTSLSEEGIIGSAVGLALNGLRPLPEIQFRKYADAGSEQLINCGTIRWRTAGRWHAPLVVRMPVGVSRKVGDPWHSVSGEATWAHQVGWHIAIPSTAEDAAGLLRTAIRGENPVLFFEHRALLDAEFSRGQYPGDDYCIPFGKGRLLLEGEAATVVSWGLMLERCHRAIRAMGVEADLIDLRSIRPWDESLVLASVAKTARVLIVHEDMKTLGFGAEIAAVIAEKAFTKLDAPVQRLAVPDIPIPYHPLLTEATVPSVERISRALEALLAF